LSERVLAFGVCLFLLAAAGCATAQEAVKGGVFRYAAIDEAPTLDQHVVTSDLATTIAQHIFEGLYTFDANYTPVPMLAESTDVQEDGKLVVIKLREGVKFHNGKELDQKKRYFFSNRWCKYGTRGVLRYFLSTLLNWKLILSTL
jgi:peptide/nickel transport system substrate-binding protein